jgi:drug/metabolite transporter (DMT)-like permease
VRTNALLLLAISLGWASEYLFIRWADEALPPLTVTVAMLAVAAAALFLYAGLVRRRPLLAMLRTRLVHLLVVALTVVGLPEFTVIWAEDSITADDASLSGATVPMLTLLVTMFVTRQQKAHWLPLAGIVVALLGLVIFVGPGDQVGTTTLGLLTREGGLVLFVFGGIYASLKTQDLDKVVMTAWTMALAALLLLPPALLLETIEVGAFSGAALWSILASGLASLALAYLGYFALIDRAGASFAALYAFLVPPLSLLVGVLLREDTMSLGHIGGLALVLAGLWMIMRGEKRTPAPRSGG